MFIYVYLYIHAFILWYYQSQRAYCDYIYTINVNLLLVNIMQILHTSPTRLKDKTFILIRFKLVYQQSCKNSEYRLIVRPGSGEVYSISFHFIFPLYANYKHWMKNTVSAKLKHCWNYMETWSWSFLYSFSNAETIV